MNRETPRGERAPDRPVTPHVRSEAPAPPVPTTDDGRNIDIGLATLRGEASGMVPAFAERAPEHITRPRGATTTYYEQPVLKPPVWKAWIPTYFFAGGLAGACAAAAASAQVVGGKRLAPIVKPARWIAAGGVVASAGLLVADLGRPSRFLNMLRVFRPTSPMNVGTWILTAAGMTTAAAAALPLVGARRMANAAGIAAGVIGLPLATYTAVLVSNTAVPAWQGGRRSLPPLFAASAAASAGSALDVVGGLGRASRAVTALGVAGKVAELALGKVYEHELARRGEVVARHVTSGKAKRLFRLSKALTGSSAALSLAGARRASGLLGLAGALTLRFAIMEAGRSSASDPRATFEPQRAT